MTTALEKLGAERYRAVLESCLAGSGEDVLRDAYDLGRWALARGLGAVHVAELHHEALMAVLQRLTLSEDIVEAVKRAAAVEAESLSVFEMAMRGYEEANVKLRESNERLEAANQELDAFAYSVSHDLRAPLRGIDGFSQALLDDYGDKLDEQAHHYLERVRAAAQHMSVLIDDLLNLSRIARAPLRKEPVDLTELAHGVVAGLSMRQPSRKVTVDVAEDLYAFGDAHLVTIVLENLIGNAWKFTANRSDAQIEVGQRKDGNGPVFYVSDNGAGFDMAYADKLFAPFQRLHGAAEFEGTGIGLATVHRIISRHGGRVWAQSTVHGGATFFFTLESGQR